MTRRKVDAKSRRAVKRQGLVKVVSFTESNGAGTTPYQITCEQCSRIYDGGEQSWIKDRPCLCGHEYARYV